MTSAELSAYIRGNASRETAVDDVAELMAPHASDSRWIYLGGSGARQQIFRLNGNLRAVFEFDRNDRLVAYGSYETTEPWKQDGSDPAMPPSDVLLVLL